MMNDDGPLFHKIKTNQMTIQAKSFALLFLLVQAFSCSCAFVTTEQASCFSPPSRTVSAQSALSVSRDSQDASRRSLLGSAFLIPAALTCGSSSAFAASREPLPEVLYRILRVREATQQETRLIKSGKFKDVQRANVKLAVRFMVDNYRLNDAFVTASAYLDGSSARRVEAGQIGTRAVQNLYTILEYFDSSDVQNIKVRLVSISSFEPKSRVV